MIDIIIPVYKAKNTLLNLLMDIANQNNINDFKVYLIIDDDGEDYSSEVEFAKKHYQIEIYYLKNNVGAGLARQYGIDKSNNPYIIFIDADDLFFSSDSIKILYDSISDDYDYVQSVVYNEFTNNYFCNEGDLHGKIYKRSFLEKNHIFFNDSRFHEDNAFNSMVLINNPKMKSITEITYIYSYNKESLTKKDEEKEFERLKIYIDNIRYVLNYSKSNNCDNKSVDNYLQKKYTYLKKIYNNSDMEQRQLLNSWLNSNKLKEL